MRVLLAVLAWQAAAQAPGLVTFADIAGITQNHHPCIQGGRSHGPVIAIIGRAIVTGNYFITVGRKVLICEMAERLADSPGAIVRRHHYAEFRRLIRHRLTNFSV